MLVVRVETDWYAHETEFRYVLQTGEGITVAGEEQHRTADAPPVGRALIPAIRAAGRVQRVGDEHQRAVPMLRGDEGGDPPTERMTANGRLLGRWRRGQVDRHGALCAALRELNGGSFDAALAQAPDLGREAGGAAGRAMGEEEACHAAKGRAARSRAWYI